MATSILFIHLTLFFFNKPTIKALICPSPNVIQLGPQHCLYVQHFENLPSLTRQEADDQCRALDQGNYKWHLPKLDNDFIERALTDAIKTETDRNEWVIWIGLMRDLPTDESESMNTTRWGEKSKWRWTVDNSTLESSFPSVAPPWLPLEPNHNNQAELERCVVAQLGPNWKRVHWYDMTCDIHFYGYSESPISVCESLPLTKSPMAMKSVSTETCGSGRMGWQWVLFGVAIILIVISAGLTGITLFMKRNYMKRQQDELAML